MIIGFNANNFKCFSEDVNVSLIAEDQRTCKFFIGDVPVISHMAICGDNSTGKSSLLSIPKTLCDIVKLGKIPEYAKNWYCLLDRKNRVKDTSLEIIFTLNKVTYSYGIKVCLNTGKISQEWINELSTNGTSLLLVGRDENNIYTLARHDKFSKDDHSRFRLYTEDMTSSEVLITKLSQVSFREESGLNLIKDIQKYLANLVLSYTEDNEDIKVMASPDINVLHEMINTLNSFGADISNILSRNVLLPACITRDDLVGLTEGRYLMVKNNKNLYLITRNETGEIESSELTFEHWLNDSSYRLSYQDESKSSRKLIDFTLIFLSDESTGHLITIDDIEQGLSTDLLTNLFTNIEDFYNTHDNPKQIIFTTGDSDEVYPVYCLEAQNIFHTVRDPANGFTLTDAHPTNDSYPYGYDEDTEDNDDYQEMESDEEILAKEDIQEEDVVDFFYGKDNSENVPQELDEEQDENKVEDGEFFEEEIIEVHPSLASELPIPAPLADREYESWSDHPEEFHAQSTSAPLMSDEEVQTGTEEGSAEEHSDEENATEKKTRRRHERHNSRGKEQKGRRRSAANPSDETDNEVLDTGKEEGDDLASEDSAEVEHKKSSRGRKPRSNGEHRRHNRKTSQPEEEQSIDDTSDADVQPRSEEAPAQMVSEVHEENIHPADDQLE